MRVANYPNAVTAARYDQADQLVTVLSTDDTLARVYQWYKDRLPRAQVLWQDACPGQAPNTGQPIEEQPCSQDGTDNEVIFRMNDGSIQITTYAAQTTIVSLYDKANYSQNGDSH